MKQNIAIGIFVVLLSVIALNHAKAQDPIFSQPYANPLYLNPAFAGTGNSQRIGFNFSDEWPSVPGNFVMYNASYDRNIIDSNNGIGILINQANSGSGEVITNNLSLIYAHQFHIGSFTVSAGMQVTYLQRSIEESQLNFANTSQPVRGFVYTTQEQLSRTSIAVPDFSAGVLGYGKFYFVGFSADHLSQPNESFTDGQSPLPLKYTVNAGVMVHAGTVIISPTILYLKQGDFSQEVEECNFSIWHITAGLGYINQGGLIFLVGYQGSLLRVGYSYDNSFSGLSNAATGGAHEISLAVLLPYSCPKFKKTNSINCPFF